MKFIKVIFLTTMIAITSETFCQCYIIKYGQKATVNITPEQIDNAPEVLKNKLQEAILNIKNRLYIYELKYIDGKSLYKFLSIKQIDDPDNVELGGKVTSTETYKDFTTGFCYMTGGNMPDNVAAKENFRNSFTWVLMDGNKTINGWHCKKASCDYNGQKVVAWYTEDIPLMDGPRQFAGLPGLILKLEFDNGVIEAIEINVPDTPCQNIQIPKKQKFITFQDYSKMNKSILHQNDE